MALYNRIELITYAKLPLFRPTSSVLILIIMAFDKRQANKASYLAINSALSPLAMLSPPSMSNMILLYSC